MEEMLTDLINRFENAIKIEFSRFDYRLNYFPWLNLKNIKAIRCIYSNIADIANIIKNEKLYDLEELVINDSITKKFVVPP